MAIPLIPAELSPCPVCDPRNVTTMMNGSRAYFHSSSKNTLCCLSCKFCVAVDKMKVEYALIDESTVHFYATFLLKKAT